MRTVGSWCLTTQTRCRVNFVGIAQMVRVDGTANELLGRQVCLSKHDRHMCFLLHPNTVFSGDASTVSYAAANDLTRQFLCPMLFSCVPLIIEHQWMQVTIASMEDISDAQTVLFAELLDLA